LIRNRPNRILLTLTDEYPDAGTLLYEIDTLERLNYYGIPVPKMWGPYRVMAGGRKSAAVMMKRYAFHDRDFAWQDLDTKLIKKAISVLNDKTLKDLLRIREILEENRMVIDDIQFLFDHDGSLVVTDPLDFTEGIHESEFEERASEQTETLDDLEAGIRVAIDIKKGLISLKEVKKFGSWSWWSSCHEFLHTTAKEEAA
jgi:hypothetical protein